MTNNPLTQFENRKEKFIDDLVHGKNEDIFVRNARKKEFEKTYGGPRQLVAWIPGMFAYGAIKKDIRNPNYTTTEKIASCAIDIILELGLDAARIGCLYGIYKTIEFM